MAGGQLESLEPLLRILRATTRVAVVPGIIGLDVHGPAAVVELYAEAERTAPGRLVVGLGGPQRLRVGALAALRSALDELDSGSAVPRDRRLLAALGPRKLDLARERLGGAVTLVVDQMVVLDEAPATARAAAREPLGFLAGVGGYAAAFSRMGFDDGDVRALSDRLVDAAFAWGGEERVVARVREQEGAGADHVVIAPVPTPDGPDPLAVAERLAARLPP